VACGQGIQLRLDIIASAGQGSVLQDAGGQQLVQREGEFVLLRLQ